MGFCCGGSTSVPKRDDDRQPEIRNPWAWNVGFSIFSWDLAANKDTDNSTRGTHYDALDITAGGTLSGIFSSLPQVVHSSGTRYDQNILNPGSGYGFTINGSSLTWSAVPEASNALITGLLGAGIFRRRRK